MNPAIGNQFVCGKNFHRVAQKSLFKSFSLNPASIYLYVVIESGGADTCIIQGFLHS